MSDGASPARLVPNRFPRPMPLAAAPRREIRLRPATASDTIRCTTLSTTYTTSHVWQLDTRQEGDEIRVSFRQVRLPRELTLATEHHPPSAPPDARRQGRLWLVAEEVDVAPTAIAPAAIAIRGRPAADEAPLRDRLSPIVGYVAVAYRDGDAYAYLQSLTVDSVYRRRGIAGRLLTEGCRWAADQGAGRMMADVAARNYPALRLLMKAGFTFCGYNDRSSRDNEVAVFFSVGLRSLTAMR
ncbi:MAG: GNAT family N-acetyltransferase [Chloroflexota bacterium]|nr:GNAT family N-acetyltransferase [Chloroflexota bacterium]